jgi:rod shape-determining protein MreD
MMGEAQLSGWRVVISALIGLILAIVPLPDALEIIRPDFLLLITVYWGLTAPRLAGLAFSWLCGFGIDILHGVVLGQHAAGFLVVAASTQYFQLRLRIFPIWQQAFAVFIMLITYQFVVFWIDGIVGSPVFDLRRWLPALTGALLWPILVATLDTWNRRRR